MESHHYQNNALQIFQVLKPNSKLSVFFKYKPDNIKAEST